MSRTYRRSRTIQTVRRQFKRNPEFDGPELNATVHNRKETQAAKIAWVRRDHPSGRWGVPHWFKHLENSLQKRRNQTELRRCQRQDAWDSHSPLPFRRQERWYWFNM